MKWQEMNAATRPKAIIFAVIVVACFVALLWPAGTVHPRRRPSPFPARSAPVARPMPRAGGHGFAQAAPGAATGWLAIKDGPLVGKWESESAEATKRGICTLSLEINRRPLQPGSYVGAARLSCIAIPSPDAKFDRNTANLVAPAGPLSAAMSGAWDKGGITFHIDRLFNAAECGWTTFSASRFGSDGLAVEFHDPCGDGAMVLRRAT